MTIRDRLRSATRDMHDHLDRAMPHDLADTASYSRFLHIQLAARKPIEAWLSANAPQALIPPSQTGNIRADLEQIGVVPSRTSGSFDLPSDADALGAAWVLAGSHLGNRFLLRQLPEDAGVPTAFLADQRMIAFWKQLQPRLQQEATQGEAASTIRAAKAVFALFLEQVEISSGRMAA